MKGPEVATFRTKTLDFILVIRLIGRKKLNEGVRRAPWSSILFIVNYCCTRVLLYAKMLKETENEETRFFCQTFIIGGISIEEARTPWATPWVRL